LVYQEVGYNLIAEPAQILLIFYEEITLLFLL